MDTKILGGWTHMQKQYWNSMTICSLTASGSGLLFLQWIFSSVCCILPRYYISFVVFVYFPVPYTLRSFSETSRSAGTDLTISCWPQGLARWDVSAKWDKPNWRHPSHSRPPAKGVGSLLCTRDDVCTGDGTGRAVCHVSQLDLPLEEPRSLGRTGETLTVGSVTRVSCLDAPKSSQCSHVFPDQNTFFGIRAEIRSLSETFKALKFVIDLREAFSSQSHITGKT